jgi:hypothetical protein
MAGLQEINSKMIVPTASNKQPVQPAFIFQKVGTLIP